MTQEVLVNLVNFIKSATEDSLRLALEVLTQIVLSCPLSIVTVEESLISLILEVCPLTSFLTPAVTPGLTSLLTPAVTPGLTASFNILSEMVPIFKRPPREYSLSRIFRSRLFQKYQTKVRAVYDIKIKSYYIMILCYVYDIMILRMFRLKAL